MGWRWVVLAAVVWLSLFWGMGRAPLFDKDEGAFAEATREMRVSGDYLMTFLNGAPRYDKPILIYWLQATSVRFFGLNEFAVRLPSSLASLLWAGLLCGFTYRRFGARPAFLATFMLLTALQVSLVGKAAIADALLNACIAGAGFALWTWWESGRKASLRWSYAWMGIGFLTKGPMALLAPLGTVLFFALVMRDGRKVRGAFADPWAWGLFAGIALPWYVAALATEGTPILAAWFGHTIGRAADPMEGHGGGYFSHLPYYIPVVLIGLLPWAGLFLRRLAGLRQDLRDPFAAWCWCWFAFTFLFMTFAVTTKLPHYVVYGYTPLFILFACKLDTLRSSFWTTVPLALFLVLAALLAPLLAFLGPQLEGAYVRAVANGLQSEFAGALPSMAVLLAGLMGWHAITRKRDWTVRIVGPGAIMLFVLNGMLLPKAAAVLQEPIKEAAHAAKALDEPIVQWGLGSHPSFIFYLERLVEQRTPKVGEVVVTDLDHIAKLREAGGAYHPLYERHGIVLARIGLPEERP